MVKRKNIVLLNGKIHTMDKDMSIVSCVVIEDGKYVFIGDSSGEVLQKYPEYPCVDLNGLVVLPGFIDAHAHPRHFAEQYYGVNLSGLNSISKYQKTLKEFRKKNPKARIIRGMGWLESLVPITGLPKEALDEIDKDIPIVLTADSGHSYWLNSKALEMAGITKDSQNIPGGIIHRNKNGEPTGTVREKAMDIVNASIEDFSVEEYKKAFLMVARKLNALGVIGVMDAWLAPGSNAVKAYKELAKTSELSLYVRGAYLAVPEKDIVSQIETFTQNREQDSINDFFCINTVKIFADGIVEGKTARLLEPYSDNEEDNKFYRGFSVWTQEDLNQIISSSIESKFQVHVHCIGDGAVQETLDAFQFARDERRQDTRRNIIAHIELIAPDDIKRMKKLGIDALLNPYWANVDDLYFSNLRILGKNRTDNTWPIHSLIKEGINCCSGSDFPVTDIPNPLNAIEMGITRTISQYYHPWAEEYETGKYDTSLGGTKECTSLDDMLRASTILAAHSMFVDDFTGSIEMGKNGDFIILDQDIYEVPPKEITNIKVIETYICGNRVYKAPM